MEQIDKNMSFENEELELQKIDVAAICMDFLRAFRRMWLRVVILGVLGAILSGVYADSQYRAYYTASATFTIKISEEQSDGTTTSSNYFDNAAAEQMAITFPYILTSGALQRKVAKEMGVAAISGSIKAEAEENTNLFTLSVRDTDPERANATLQAVIENYPSFSEVIIGKVNMKILDETGVPTSPDNPKSLKADIMQGGMFGISAGLIWVGLVAVLRRTIRREEDCPKYVNQRCLGSVPLVHFKERSKKIDTTLNIADDAISQDFKESIRIIRNKVERSAKENALKTVLITSTLAGEGKSTIAVNLAISLAQEGKRVALVDCDLRNPSDAEILAVDAQKGLVNYLKKEIPFNECIYNNKMRGITEEMRFLFIPGGKAISDGATLLGTERMKKIVEALKEKMDYVILDSAPVGLLTDAGVLAQYADGAVFIVKKDFAKADHIMEGMEHLAESNIHMMGCVLNGD